MFQLAYASLYDGGQLYTSTIDRLYRSRNLATSKWLYYAEQTCLLLIALRLGNLLLPLLGTEVYHLDPVQNFFIANKELYGNLYFEVVSLIMPLYCFHLRYLFCTVPEKNMCWYFFHDVVVRGSSIFQQCRKADYEIERLLGEKVNSLYGQYRAEYRLAWQITPTWLFRWMVPLIARLSIKLHCDDIDKEKLMHRPLKENPNMSFKLRARLALLVELFNKASTALLVSANFAMVLVAVVYVPRLCAPYPRWAIPLICLDCCIFYHLMNLLLKVALTLNYCAIISSTVNVYHISYYNRQMDRLIDLSEKEGQTIDGRFSFLLRQILAEHVRVCIQVVRSNKDIFGNLTLSSLVCNIPINVALISRLVFQKLPPFERIINEIFVVGQFALLAVALYPLAYYSKVVHYSKRVPKLQMILSREIIALKLKYMLYYERIHSSKKYGITIGPTSTLNNQVLAEMVFVYFGYLLYGFGIVIENNIY